MKNRDRKPPETEEITLLEARGGEGFRKVGMQKEVLLKVKNKIKGEREGEKEGGRKGEGKAGRRKAWEAGKLQRS